jgi:hypothetical protein
MKKLQRYAHRMIDNCGNWGIVRVKDDAYKADYVLYAEALAHEQEAVKEKNRYNRKLLNENIGLSNECAAYRKQIERLRGVLEDIRTETGDRPGHEKWEYYCERLYKLHILSNDALKEAKP